MTESIRVLHVDDEPDFADTAAGILEREDDRLTVETAVSASRGLDRLAAGRFDCVVSDHDMPGMDGIEFLETVRETDPDLPFILFTGKGSEEVASEAISAGVTDYLRKGTDSERYQLLAKRITDAVERRRAETNYREIFENVPDGIVIQDLEDGSFVDMNERYARMFGYDRDEFLEAGFEAILPDEPPHTIEHARKRIRQAAEQGPQTFAWPTIRKDGERIWAEVHLAPIRLHGRDRLLAVVRDVTERRERERELREESELLDAVFEHVPVHLYVKDEAARLRRLSEFYVDDPDARIGKTDREIAPGEFGEAAYADDMEVIETGEPIINREEYLSSRDRWALTSKAPWYGEEGEIKGLVGATRVITERKEYEQELQRQNERLEKFAGAISHDLRNPLNMAEGRVELARAECDSEHLDGAADALERMEVLIEDVLSLARRGEKVGETEPVDLADTIEGCRRSVETGTATVLTETERRILADRTRLQQLLENLIRNAVEHGSTSSQPSADDAVEHGSTSSQPSADDAVEHGGEAVTVTVGDVDGGFYVADDGPGIPPKDREEVFDAGYSTTREGTGFGLSIVEEIAEAHGWTVTVTESEEGGARFEITGVETAG